MRHRAVASILSERFVGSLYSRRAKQIPGVVAASSPESKSKSTITFAPNLQPTFEIKISTASPPRTFGTATTIIEGSGKEYQAFLESLSPAQKKFLDVLREYRSKNFEHTMPKRFLQMIIKAVDGNHDGVITLEEYQTLLINIGAREKMTDEDLNEIFEKLGDDELDGKTVITVQRIEKAWAPFLNIIWKL